MTPKKQPFMLQHLPLPEQQFHAHSDETLIVGTNTGVIQSNHQTDTTRKSTSDANNKSN